MAVQIAHKIEARKRTKDIDISEDLKFAELLLSASVLKGLTKAGFHRPSPIQLKAIPLGRCGLDLIVQAKSGTGKTCVFTVIALEGLEIESSAIQVLVLAPTREIASQIWEVVRSIGSAIPGLRCHTFIGGMPIAEDKHKLAKCHIAIGTPGRMKQLIAEGLLKTDSIRLFVLDEADKLLEEGFQEQINWIYSSLPECKQMLALSATYPEYLAQHLTVYMKNPTFVRLNSNDPALLGIKQYYKIVPYSPLTPLAFQTKALTLIHLLSSASFQQCLVFSNHQSGAESLCNLLNSRGWPATCIAGKQEQSKRMLAMTKLRSYQCRVLVSTDLTSRGIDADNVNMVVNLDVPWDHETYLHRIGRAGRYGSFGAAVTIAMSGQEEAKLHTIQTKCNTVIHALPDPVPSDLVEAAVPQLSPSMEELVTTKEIITTSSHLSGAELKANTSPTSEHGTRIVYTQQSDGDGRQICSNFDNLTEMKDYCKLNGKISDVALENNLKSVTHESVSHIIANSTSRGEGDRLGVSGSMNSSTIAEPEDGTDEGAMNDSTQKCASENSVCRTFSSSTVTLEPALDSDEILDEGSNENNAETSSSDNSVSQLTTPTLTLSDILNDNYVHEDESDTSIQQNNNGLEMTGVLTNQCVDLINGDCELYTPSISIGALSSEHVVNGVHNDIELANAISQADRLVNKMSILDVSNNTPIPEQSVGHLTGENPVVENSIDIQEAPGIDLSPTKDSSVLRRGSDHATPTKESSGTWETHAELLSLTPEKCIVTDLPDTLFSDFTSTEPCDVAINNLLGQVNWKMRSPETLAYQAMVNELKDAASVHSGNNTPALSPCSTDGTLYAVSSISTQQDNSYAHTEPFLSNIDNLDNVAQYASFSNNATGYEFNSDGMVCENDNAESMLVYCGGISDGTIQHAEQQDAVEVPQLTIPMQKTNGSAEDDYLTAEEQELHSQAQVEQVNYVSQHQATNVHSEFAETWNEDGSLDATRDLQKDDPQTVVVIDVTDSVIPSVPIKSTVDPNDTGFPNDFTIPQLKSRSNHRKWHKYSSALTDLESSQISQDKSSDTYIDSIFNSSEKIYRKEAPVNRHNLCEFIIPPYQNGFPDNGSSRVWHTYASAVEELDKFAAEYSNARDYNAIDWEAEFQIKKMTPTISPTLLDSLSYFLTNELKLKFVEKEVNHRLETLDNHDPPIEAHFVEHLSANILDNHISPRKDESLEHSPSSCAVSTGHLNNALSCVSITDGVHYENHTPGINVPTQKTTDDTIMSEEASRFNSEVPEKHELDNYTKSNSADSVSPKAACLSVANQCLIAEESDVLANLVSANALPVTEVWKEDVSLGSSISTADTEYLELDYNRQHRAHASLSSESAVTNDEVTLMMENDSSVTTSYDTNSIQSNDLLKVLSATDTNGHLLSDVNIVKEVLEDCVSRVVVASEIDEVISECHLKSNSIEDVSLLDVVSKQMLNSALTHNTAADNTVDKSSSRKEIAQTLPQRSSLEDVFNIESERDAMLRDNARKSISGPDIASGICHLSRVSPASKSETTLSNHTLNVPKQSTSFQSLVIHDIVNDIIENTVTNMASLAKDSAIKITKIPEETTQSEAIHENVSVAVVTNDILGLLGFVRNLVDDSISDAMTTYNRTQLDSEKIARLDEGDAQDNLYEHPISEHPDTRIVETDMKLNIDAIPEIAETTFSLNDNTNKYSLTDIQKVHEMTMSARGENDLVISESASSDSLLDALSDQAIFDTIEGSTITSGFSSIKDIKIENQLDVEILSEPDKECGDKIPMLNLEHKIMPAPNNQIVLNDSANVVVSQTREGKPGRFRRYTPMSVSSLLYAESLMPAAWNKSLKGSISQVTLPVLDHRDATSSTENMPNKNIKKTPEYNSQKAVVTHESSNTSSPEKEFVEQTSLRKVKSVASRANRGGRKSLCNKANKSENAARSAVNQKTAMIPQKKVSRLQQEKNRNLKDVSNNLLRNESILVHSGNVSESSTNSYIDSNETSDTDSSFWDTLISSTKTDRHAQADPSSDRKQSKGEKTSDIKSATKLKSGVQRKVCDKLNSESYLSPQATEGAKQRSSSAKLKYDKPVDDVNHARATNHHVRKTTDHVRAKQRQIYSDYLYSNYEHPSSLLTLDGMFQPGSNASNVRKDHERKGKSQKRQTHSKDVGTPERIGSDNISRKYKHKSKVKRNNMTDLDELSDDHYEDESINPYIQHPYGYYGAYPPVHPAIHPYWLHPAYGVPLSIPPEDKPSQESSTPSMPSSCHESPIPRMPAPSSHQSHIPSNWPPSHYYTAPQNLPPWQDPANNPSTMTWNMPPYHPLANHARHDPPSPHFSPNPQSPAYFNSPASSSKAHLHSTKKKKSTHGNGHEYSGPSDSDGVPPNWMSPSLCPPWFYNPYYSHWYPGSGSQTPPPVPTRLQPPPPYWMNSMYAPYPPQTSTQSSPEQHHHQNMSPFQHPSYWNYPLSPWQHPWHTSVQHAMQQGVDNQEKQEHLGKMMNLQQEYIRKMMKMYKIYHQIMQ